MASSRRKCPRCGSHKWTYLMGTNSGAIAGCSDCPRGDKPKITLDFVKGEVRNGD